MSSVLSRKAIPHHHTPPTPVEGNTYSTTKNKIKESVFLFKIKKDQVVLKRNKDAVDSKTISLAKFLKQYREE